MNLLLLPWRRSDFVRNIILSVKMCFELNSTSGDIRKRCTRMPTAGKLLRLSSIMDMESGLVE